MVGKTGLFIPIQRTFLKQVQIANADQQQEFDEKQHHLPATEIEVHCPWIQERDFNIESKKQHRNKIKFHVKPFACGAQRSGQTTFVWLIFSRIGIARAVGRND